jgi:hypothetical protein
MGLFDVFLGNKPKPQGTYEGKFKMISGYEPKFTTHMGSIYENQLIRACINARAIHISKLKIDFLGNAKPSLRNKLEKAPNQFQSWSQFLYRTATILNVQNTAFIIPLRNKFGTVIGIYPLRATHYELVVDEKGELWVRFHLEGNEKTAEKLSDIAVVDKAPKVEGRSLVMFLSQKR